MAGAEVADDLGRVGPQAGKVAQRLLGALEKAAGLLRRAPEDGLDVDPGRGPARRPLGDNGASLDEELGAGDREGAPQSARSPGVEVPCDGARCMRC